MISHVSKFLLSGDTCFCKIMIKLNTVVRIKQTLFKQTIKQNKRRQLNVHGKDWSEDGVVSGEVKGDGFFPGGQLDRKLVVHAEVVQCNKAQ